MARPYPLGGATASGAIVSGKPRPIERAMNCRRHFLSVDPKDR